MTRTERSFYPRAVMKDRSESKSGLDKSLRKHGAGLHNWGSLADEPYLESAALDDALFDSLSDPDDLPISTPAVDGVEPAGAADDGGSGGRPTSVERRTSAGSVTEEERENAREFRKKALKNGDLDLAAIARTSSAVSTSPPTKVRILSDADSAPLSPV